MVTLTTHTDIVISPASRRTQRFSGMSIHNRTGEVVALVGHHLRESSQPNLRRFRSA